MELTLDTLDIFDEHLYEKFQRIYETNFNDLSLEKCYKFRVRFNLELLTDPRLLHIHNGKFNQGTPNEIILDIMKFTLKIFDKIFTEKGLAVYQFMIIADILESRYSIKIRLDEDPSIQRFTQKGTLKKNSTMKEFHIVPSLPYSLEILEQNLIQLAEIQFKQRLIESNCKQKR